MNDFKTLADDIKKLVRGEIDDISQAINQAASEGRKIEKMVFTIRLDIDEDGNELTYLGVDFE